MKLVFRLFILGCAWGGVALCDDASPELSTVTFVPQWIPQAQFAGYYVAADRGLYEHEGLRVQIVKGGPESPPSGLLAQGKAHFGTFFLSDAIRRRAKGAKLVNIAQVVQRSALVLIARKSSGINVPQDLQGKRVSLWGGEFEVQPKAFFSKYQLQVCTVPQGTTVNLFLRGGVDAASGMWYNEYHLVLNAGLDLDELTVFFLADHGLNFPEDGIYCQEETLRRQPDACAAFVRASLAGWEYAFQHPEEALTIVMKRADEAATGTNLSHQRWMLSRMQDIIVPGGGACPSGALREEDYQRVAEELRRNDLIDQVPAFTDFYRAQLRHD